MIEMNGGYKLIERNVSNDDESRLLLNSQQQDDDNDNSKQDDYCSNTSSDNFYYSTICQRLKDNGFSKFIWNTWSDRHFYCSSLCYLYTFLMDLNGIAAFSLLLYIPSWNLYPTVTSELTLWFYIAAVQNFILFYGYIFQFGMLLSSTIFIILKGWQAIFPLPTFKEESRNAQYWRVVSFVSLIFSMVHDAIFFSINSSAFQHYWRHLHIVVALLNYLSAVLKGGLILGSLKDSKTFDSFLDKVLLDVVDTDIITPTDGDGERAMTTVMTWWDGLKALSLVVVNLLQFIFYMLLWVLERDAGGGNYNLSLIAGLAVKLVGLCKGLIFLTALFYLQQVYLYDDGRRRHRRLDYSPLDTFLKGCVQRCYNCTIDRVYGGRVVVQSLFLLQWNTLILKIMTSWYTGHYSFFLKLGFDILVIYPYYIGSIAGFVAIYAFRNNNRVINGGILRAIILTCWYGLFYSSILLLNSIFSDLGIYITTLGRLLVCYGFLIVWCIAFLKLLINCLDSIDEEGDKSLSNNTTTTNTQTNDCSSSPSTSMLRQSWSSPQQGPSSKDKRRFLYGNKDWPMVFDKDRQMLFTLNPLRSRSLQSSSRDAEVGGGGGLGGREGDAGDLRERDLPPGGAGPGEGQGGVREDPVLREPSQDEVDIFL